MARLILSLDSQVLAEYNMNKERYTIGRLPDNDIRIDNPAVSGHHSLIINILNDSFLEDLNSTNGTYVNGKPVKQQTLRNGDLVEMGKYKIRFLQDAPVSGYDKGLATGLQAPLTGPASMPAPLTGSGGIVRVVTGPAAGREVALTKVVTTIGKPGVAVASITKRHHNFVLAHVDGAQLPRLNGAIIGADPVALKSGDRIALAGAEMEFVQG